MNTTAIMILKWLRDECAPNTAIGKAAKQAFNDGYYCGRQWDMEAWERQYIETVRSAIRRGVAA